MPAPAYVASGTFVETATKDSSITPGLPAASDGDFQIAHVLTSAFGTGNVSPTFVTTGASGWRPLGPELYASGFTNTRYPRQQLYYRVRQSGDTAPSFQMTGGTNNGTSARIGARIHAFSNVGVVRLGPGAVGDTDPITGSGITTKATSGLVLAFTGMGDGNTVSGQAFAGGGVTSITERADDVVSTRLGLSLTTGVKTTAGATGNFTTTASGLTDPWTVIVLALEETETFPSESVLFNFNVANTELSTGNWAADTFNFTNTAVNVISNQAGGADGGGLDERSYYSALAHQADGQIAVTVPTLPENGGRAALAYRLQTPGTAGVDGYEMVTKGTAGLATHQIDRVDNKSFTTLATFTQGLVAGDKLGVRFTGSSHEIYVVPSSGPRLHVGTVTDATYTGTGYGGIGVRGTTVRLDDFILGPFSGGDTTPPGPATGLALTTPVPGTIRATFTMPSDADAERFLIRFKNGTGQTFSGPTDGFTFTAETTGIAPSAVISRDLAGADLGSGYTVAVYVGDEVPNWSTAATASISLPLPAAVALAPTVTAEMEGTVLISRTLPGVMESSFAVAMLLDEGDPLAPSQLSFLVGIEAVMGSRIQQVEPLGRDRGHSPVEIVGPLGGGQQNPAILVNANRGASSRRVLARIRR